jgi:SAM-dependent methyltransferase
LKEDYASPRDVVRIEDCYFYHTMELPGVGKVEGDWNLLPNIEEYLGNVDFKGKRVLDVGCGSGALSFYMERRGASVVSYDLDRNGDWDMVPFVKWEQRRDIVAQRKTIIDRQNNAYWYAHKALNSKAKVAYGSVYDMPDFIGPVDIAVYGSILLHLRDPFLALQNGLRFVRETVVVAELVGDLKADGPQLQFLPDAKTLEHKDAWWHLRPQWVARAIGVLGFEEVKTAFHQQEFKGRDRNLYTVVGKRTHGTAVADP